MNLRNYKTERSILAIAFCTFISTQQSDLQVTDSLEQLERIMIASQTSYQSDEKDEKTVDLLESVVSAAVGPLLEMCYKRAEVLKVDSISRLDDGKGMDPTAYHSYLINCMSVILACLSSHASATKEEQSIRDYLASYMQELSNQETQRILAQGNLESILEYLEMSVSSKYTDLQLSSTSQELVPVQRLWDAMQSFFVLISSPNVLPEFPRIIQAKYRNQAIFSVAQALADVYEKVYSALENPSLPYLAQGGASRIKHNPSQIKTILGVI